MSNTEPGGLPGTAGAEGQKRPDGAVVAAHIILRQLEVVRHTGKVAFPPAGRWQAFPEIHAGILSRH